MKDPIIEQAERERDEYLKQRNLEKHSFPHHQTLELPRAESNIETYYPKILNWEEFINQQSSDQGWIIEDLLRPGWLAVLGGHGKQGKTTLAIHLLNYLSQGKQFINNTLAVPVIHLNFEMGEDDIRELVNAVSLDSEVRENAKIVNQIPSPLDLSWLESLLVNQELPGVCVIDSFRAAFMLTGDSENQAGTVGVILRKLQAIARKTKWSILVIHHFRKSGTGEALDLAGSGEWLSAPDVIYTWSRPKTKKPGTLAITGRVSPAEPLAIQLSREKLDFLGTVDESESDAERQLILDNLTHELSKSDDLAEILNLPNSTVRKRLGELLTQNKVERQGEGKKNNPFLWRKKDVDS